MPITKETRSKKILVNVWTPLIERFNAKVKDACLNRDAFFDRVLKHEAQILGKEIIQPNSPEAKKYIAASFAGIKVKSVNFSLSEETISLVTEECNRLNIPRDSFINRVIFLMTVSEEVLDHVFFKIGGEIYHANEEYYFEESLDEKMSDYYEDACGLNWYEEQDIPFQSNIINIIGDFTRSDPFWYLRACLHGQRKNSEIPEAIPLLHARFIKRSSLSKITENNPFEVENAIFLNCFISSDQLIKEKSMDTVTVMFSDLLNEDEEWRKRKQQRQDQANRGRASK
jgi:hypothetical protein